MTILLPTPKNIEGASQILQKGGVVAFATETVYGLGCDTFNPDAIEQIYALKGRPKNNPTIAHILDASWAHELTEYWNEQCDQLAKAFWPGALTLVLPKKKRVPKEACGGRNTIAIRSPSHIVARQLLESFGSAISAPSANKSGYISPTTAKHVEDEFGEKLQIIDGGACEEGIESTVLSLISTPTILRPGTISEADITKIIGKVSLTNPCEQNDSPGTTALHYSPHTATILLTEKEMNELDDGDCVAITMNGAPKKAKVQIQMPVDPKEYGTQLYSSLREADAIGAKQIVIENPPSTSGWSAVLDRLNRCASNL
jgi:L-threonylcarbamoyladenylate synthase